MELVDIRDLKSLGPLGPCRFKSGLRHYYSVQFDKTGQTGNLRLRSGQASAAHKNSNPPKRLIADPLRIHYHTSGMGFQAGERAKALYLP